MARELVLEVIARKNSKDLNALADDFEKLARKSDAAGKSLGKTATFSEHLDSQIAKTKQSIRELGAEFDRTGDKDVFAKLRSSQANLRSLEGIRKQLATAIDKGAEDGAKSVERHFSTQAKQIGSNFGELFEGGLAGTLRSPAGIGAIAAAGAVLGNALFGTLLTGVGLGGIATGIIGQLHDPRVMAAAGALGKDVSAGFKDATSSFAEPLITGLYVFDHEWQKLQPGLKKTFTELSPLVVDLSKGAAGFADQFVPALERAAVASKPLVQDFAQYLPKLGREIGGFFDALAANRDQLITGLHEVEGAIDGVTKAATFLVPAVSHVGAAFSAAHYVLGPIEPLFHNIANALDLIHGKVPGTELLARSLVDTSGASDELAGSFGQMTIQQQQAAAESKKLADELVALEQKTRNQFSALLDLSQATGNWTHDLANLKGQLDLSGRGLNETTDAGHKNADALRQMAQEAERVREAAIAQAGGEQASAAAVDQANTKFRAQVAQLEATAIKLGLNKDAVHTLLDMYLALAKAPNIVKDVRIQQHFITTGNPSTFYHGLAKGGLRTDRGIRYAADGMVIRPSDPGTVIAGEPQTGGEVLAPLRGISRGRAMQLAGLIGNAYGFRVGGRAGGVASVASAVRPAAAAAGPSEMRVTGNPDSFFFAAFLNAYRANVFSFYDSNGQRITLGGFV